MPAPAAIKFPARAWARSCGVVAASGGKQVVAFSQGMSQSQYLLAAQADELYRRARAIQDEPDVADLAPLFAPR